MTSTNNDAPRLKRSLSLTLVSFYGIGSILGAGIYVLVGKVAGYAGMATPFAFLVASILAAFSAFSYAEISARYPRSAGEAVYVQEGIGWRFLSEIVGLSIVLAGIVSVATLVHGFVAYLHVFIPAPEALTIVTLVVVMGIIVAWGINQSVIIASVMTVLGIIGLVMIIWIARDSFSNLPTQGYTLFPEMNAVAWSGVLLGSFVAFYAFIGFEDIVNVAEEVRQPQRNLPAAIIIALIVTTLFYMLVSSVSVLTIEPQRLAQTNAPLAMMYSELTGQPATVIALISMASVLNGALIQIIMASRVLYGMGNLGWLPSWLATVNRKTRTPIYATLVVSISILFFALLLPLLSLAKLTSYIILFIFILVNLSLFLIKRRETEPATGFTVPLWVPAMGFILSSVFVLYQLVMALRA